MPEIHRRLRQRKQKEREQMHNPSKRWGGVSPSVSLSVSLYPTATSLSLAAVSISLFYSILLPAAVPLSVCCCLLLSLCLSLCVVSAGADLRREGMPLLLLLQVYVHLKGDCLFRDPKCYLRPSVAACAAARSSLLHLLLALSLLILLSPLPRCCP